MTCCVCGAEARFLIRFYHAPAGTMSQPWAYCPGHARPHLRNDLNEVRYT